MTDRWVSNAKHWCATCKIFIDAKASSRRHHEQGNRHQRNAREHLKKLRYAKVNEQREQRDAGDVMKHIEAAARGQIAHDALNGLVDAGAAAAAFTSALPRPSGKRRRGGGGVHRVRRAAFDADDARQRDADEAAQQPDVAAKVDVDEATGMGAWEVVQTTPTKQKKIDADENAAADKDAVMRREAQRGFAVHHHDDDDDDDDALVQLEDASVSAEAAAANPAPVRDADAGVDVVFKKRKRTMRGGTRSRSRVKTGAV